MKERRDGYKRAIGIWIAGALVKPNAAAYLRNVAMLAARILALITPISIPTMDREMFASITKPLSRTLSSISKMLKIGLWNCCCITAHYSTFLQILVPDVSYGFFQ